jgi:hypothetical protein
MVSCVPRWQAIRWITATALSGIWPGCTATNGGLTLTPGIGVQYSSENYNDYYYGVSKNESRRSGLKTYGADDGWDPYLELTASYNFLGDWSVWHWPLCAPER